MMQAHADADKIRNSGFTHKEGRMVQIGGPRKTTSQNWGSGSAWIGIIFWSWIWIRITVESLIRIRIQVKILKLWRLKNFKEVDTVDARNGGLEAQNEPWRVYRPEVIDSHHFDEDPDPEQHWSEKLDTEGSIDRRS